MKPCFAGKSTEFTKHYSCTKKPINNVCPVYMLNLLFTLIFVVGVVLFVCLFVCLLLLFCCCCCFVFVFLLLFCCFCCCFLGGSFPFLSSSIRNYGLPLAG